MVYILLIIGFVALIYGAEILVRGASSLAKKLGISPLVIGLTIVAFGTSAPELFVNSWSAFQGNTDLAFGNVVGSNIANLFLVLGVSAMVYPITAKSSTIYKEIPFSLVGSFAVLFLAYDTFFSGASTNILTRGEGLVLLLFFAIFFVYTFGIAKVQGNDEEDDIVPMSYPKSAVLILAGLIGLAGGAHLLVSSATSIAESFGVSSTVIGLTVVSIGTSLPELVTGVIAARKKRSDIVIGGVIGSNIFNIFLILGITAVISPIYITETAAIFDLVIELIGTILLFVFLIIVRRKTVLSRGEGAIFFILYLLYMAYLYYTQVYNGPAFF